MLVWEATRYIPPIQYHYHPSAFEIHIVRRDSGKYRIGNRIYPFQGYLALVVQPNMGHRYIHRAGQWLNQVTLTADQSLLSGRKAEALLGKLPEWIKLTSAELNTLEMRCRMLEHEIAHPSAISPDMVRNELENLIFLLQKAGEARAAEPVSDSRILKVLDFIEENYDKKINIGQMAGFVSISPDHLSHRFKQQTGVSIKHYLLQCRIAAAKLSLESERDVKIAVLAEQLGFSELSLFNRCFKRYVNVTPAAYRRISYKHSGI